MTFVSPAFLWALTAIAVPVIIHLFNFRRYKKVYFSNVRFLRELQLESKSRSRLKELLILCCRCLAVACLVLAFSQPIIKGEASKETHSGLPQVSVYIDNSFSMENIGSQGPLLQQGIAQAKTLINTLGNGPRYHLITNDFEGRHQRFYSREDMLALLEEIKISPAPKNLHEVILRQTAFLNAAPGTDRRSFIFSDAQRSTFDLEQSLPDSTIRYAVLPLNANKINNVTVDTCWFESPLQQKGFILRLHALVRNNGESPIDAGSGRLMINNKQIALASYSLEPHGSAELVFTFENREVGYNYGSIKIEDFPVSFDDELFFAFSSRINIDVTLINGNNNAPHNPFTSLFSGDSLFHLNVQNENAIDFSKFKNSNLVILNGLSVLTSGLQSELEKFRGSGGVVVIIPPLKLNPNDYNPALSDLQLPVLLEMDTVSLHTDKLEFAEHFYQGVFEKKEERMNLPIISKHYRIEKNRSNTFEPQLLLQNGDPLFGFSKKGNGSAFLFTSPMDEEAGNFTKHALFVPTFYKIAFNSVVPAPLFYEAGSNVRLQVKETVEGAETPPHIKGVNVKSDVIPEIRRSALGTSLYTRTQITQPGYYELINEQNKMMPLAFNYARKEGDLSTFTHAELEGIVAKKGWKNFRIVENNSGDTVQQLALEAGGKKLWKLFIILAVIFIAVETLLLRFLK